MEVLTQRELRVREEEILDKIKRGALFIYPTDTIYGIGCVASDACAVEKVRLVKKRADTPFSIWVPSLAWVRLHCVVDSTVEGELKNLPGPITLILKLKDRKSIVTEVNNGAKTIGIRYPNHWFGKMVEKLGVAIVTTSVNIHGKPFMISIEDLDPGVETQIEFMIYEGPKDAKPSKIINLVEGGVRER